MNSFHRSVLLKEAIEFLNVQNGKKYIDTTLGGGGHTFEILKRGGEVLGIDTDRDAIEFVQEEIKNQNSKIKNWERLTLTQGNFKDLKKIAHLNNFENIDGIIFDLGVSSYQLNTKERGFSFQNIGPLDMRMDKSIPVKAADLVNILTKGELYELFTRLGEERNARAISNNIIRARRIKPIETTGELALIIKESYGIRGKVQGRVAATINTKVFQALRIAVNDELNNLKEALPQAVELLKGSGRVVTISFHSLEDRIIKESFIEFKNSGLGKILTKKVVKPELDEIKTNPRSRSAKLRVFERI
ncbi:MAG: 16S rRNA (cytosine(1402)-N(4))-methyltransferase RsmH [Candidatus Levybacteria bacterium]|nr:16S rRNA (cytosine(1402)-N(4))-methyltransferase RsmH [Candidatus Levybacteria bacterium]